MLTNRNSAQIWLIAFSQLYSQIWFKNWYNYHFFNFEKISIFSFFFDSLSNTSMFFSGAIRSDNSYLSFKIFSAFKTFLNIYMFFFDFAIESILFKNWTNSDVLVFNLMVNKELFLSVVWSFLNNNTVSAA